MKLAIPLFLLYSCRCIHNIAALQPQKQQQSQQQPYTSNNNQIYDLVDIPKLKRTVTSGRVYQQRSFLTEQQVQTILQEVNELQAEGRFTRKGLSNTAVQNQQFSNVYDRSICVIPWFNDALQGKNTNEIPKLISDLRHTLSVELNRPTMLLNNGVDDSPIEHECYYSKSEVGSKLNRHMDERHEELKGSKGYLKPSRRSISWLIYLSDPVDWTLRENGGALRSFPQKQFQVNQEDSNNALLNKVDSTHDGNLQIGWLLPDDSGTTSATKRVYLDSWYPITSTGGVTNAQVDPSGATTAAAATDNIIPEYHCILYTVNENSNNDTNERQYITQPWLSDSIQGMTISDFINEFAKMDSSKNNRGEQQPMLFTSPQVAKRFALLEDRNLWDTTNGDPVGSYVEDIIPLRGSLVVFDSVTVPHQVEIIKNGTRIALAGWFHEATQSFPETYY